MANEKRLIYADALIAEYDRVHIGEPGKARKLIEDAPTVDAVEVVRCKDCKHWNARYDYCNRKEIEMFDESFCSYGERREKE